MAQLIPESFVGFQSFIHYYSKPLPPLSGIQKTQLLTYISCVDFATDVDRLEPGSTPFLCIKSTVSDYSYINGIVETVSVATAHGGGAQPIYVALCANRTTDATGNTYDPLDPIDPNNPHPRAPYYNYSYIPQQTYLKSMQGTIDVYILFPSMLPNGTPILDMNNLAAKHRWMNRILTSTEYAIVKPPAADGSSAETTLYPANKRCPGVFNTLKCGANSVVIPPHDNVKNPVNHKQFALYKLTNSGYLHRDLMYTNMEIYEGCDYQLISSNNQYIMLLDGKSGIIMVQNTSGKDPTIACRRVNADGTNGGLPGDVIVKSVFSPATNEYMPVYSRVIMGTDGTLSIMAFINGNETTVWTSPYL